MAPGLVLAGCIDFVEPDLPELGAPAVLEAAIQLSDSGTVEIDARLAPGLDEMGYRREVADDAIRLLARTLAPDSIQRNGTRRYTAEWEADPSVVAQPTDFRGPAMRGVEAPVPEVLWTGIRRMGPGELDIEPDSDVALLVEAGAGDASPVPDIRQWFLSMNGDSTNFGLSADGAPPDTIRIPARWIPDGDTVEVRLILSQSAILQPPPGDYVGLVTLRTRLYWTLRRIPPRDAGSIPAPGVVRPRPPRPRLATLGHG